MRILSLSDATRESFITHVTVATSDRLAFLKTSRPENKPPLTSLAWLTRIICSTCSLVWFRGRNVLSRRRGAMVVSREITIFSAVSFYLTPVPPPHRRDSMRFLGWGCPRASRRF
ncbi:hypothetical protein AAMO2058_000302000 [Amorphochlora amoebiformis]